MKKVVLQIYAAIACIALVVATVYVISDLSRIQADRFDRYQEKASALAALISRGKTPPTQALDSVLQILLIEGEQHRTLYQGNQPSRFTDSFLDGSYTFPLPGKQGSDRIEIRLLLLEMEDMIPRFRLLLFLSTGIVLLTGILLAFYPDRRPAAPAQNMPDRNRRASSATPPATTCLAPDSGLMSGEHLNLRLESELKRAASFDQDLVMVLIAFDPDSEEFGFRELAQEILRFFIFKDLCFEYAGNIACVIVPNTELDEGIRRLREFRKQVNRTLGTSSILGGLSSRSGRLLEAQTLIKEAEAALQKSREDTDRAIFGFRADPSKYRALVSEV